MRKNIFSTQIARQTPMVTVLMGSVFLLYVLTTQLVVPSDVFAANESETKLRIAGESSEVASLSNGAIVTPSENPYGINGTLTLLGTGSVNYSPALVGNGVSFKNGGQQKINTAFYKFTGTQIGNIFDTNEGEIIFSLKSAYSIAERKLLPQYNYRYTFEVKDTATRNLYNFITYVNTSGSLIFYFNAGFSAQQYYYAPSGQEEILFGKDKILNVRLVWDGSKYELYLNDALAKSATYTRVIPEWSSTSIFTLGAASGYEGGFHSSDDVIDEFTIIGPSPIDTQGPNIVNDLGLTGVTSATARLSWTAPSDVSSTDSVASYDIRYATSAIDIMNWDNALQVAEEPIPAASGASEEFLVTDLLPETTYTVVLRSYDVLGNISDISNQLSFTTEPRPSAISNLHAVSGSGILSWDLPTDPRVAKVLIYRDTEAYPSMGGVALVDLSPTVNVYSDTSVAPNTTYYYSLYTKDATGTYSDPVYVSFATVEHPSAISDWSSYLSTSGNYANSPWASTVRNSNQESIASTQLPNVNIVAVETLGLESAKNQASVDAYMADILADNGESWREGMYIRTKDLIELQNVNPHTVAWQIGNEISSIHYVNAFNTWSAANPSKVLPGDPTIPYYVEYYLAPSVEGIRRAENELGIDIPVVLGSISEAYNPSRRIWLDDLLSYTITGTYAPSLAGMTVSEIIEIISVHYLVTVDSSWETSLDEIWNKWHNVGTVRGLWSTEEQGGKAGGAGRGAATEARVFARYNKWWIKNHLTSEQGLVSFWGPELVGTAGTTTSGNYSLGLINYHFDDGHMGSVIDYSDLLTLPNATGAIESYLYGNTADSDSLVAIVSSKSLGDSMNFNTLQFSVPGWTESITATAHLLSTTGDSETSPLVTQAGGAYTVTLPSPIDYVGSSTSTNFPAYLLLLKKNI